MNWVILSVLLVNGKLEVKSVGNRVTDGTDWSQSDLKLETYGVKDGKIVLESTKSGSLTPRQVSEEIWK